MKTLIVANNKSGKYDSFVMEQGESLKVAGVEVEYFGVSGKGIKGYLKCLPALKQKIKEYNPDVLHAHYGLSGLLANLQRKVPVVTTFHGSDIHSLGWQLKLSRLAMKLSAHNIFVSEYLYNIANYKATNYTIQACGLDTETIKPCDKQEARKYFGWDSQKQYVLFSGAFTNTIKNYPLAKESIAKLNNVELIELKGFTRNEISLLMNACDCLLLTSFREASPTVIKEAMACNRPLVATEVGDVRWLVNSTEGCYVTTYDANDCAAQIKKALEFSAKNGATNGRERLMEVGLDTKSVANTIKEIYSKVIK